MKFKMQLPKKEFLTEITFWYFIDTLNLTQKNDRNTKLCIPSTLGVLLCHLARSFFSWLRNFDSIIQFQMLVVLIRVFESIQRKSQGAGCTSLLDPHTAA